MANKNFYFFLHFNTLTFELDFCCAVKKYFFSQKKMLPLLLETK